MRASGETRALRRGLIDPTYAPITYTIETSTDGTSFNVAYNFSANNVVDLANYSFDFGANRSARYIKMSAFSGSIHTSTQTWIAIYEFGAFVCPEPLAPAPTCTDGIKNGNETDVDCGGGTCAACAVDDTCATNADCSTALCNSGVFGSAICASTLPFPVAHCKNVAANMTTTAGFIPHGVYVQTFTSPSQFGNDGSCSTSWTAGYADGTGTGWWEVDLGSPQAIRGVALNSGSWSGYAVDFNYKIEISPDRTTFNAPKNTPNPPDTSTNNSFDFGADQTARYIRVTANAFAAAPALAVYPTIYEFAAFVCP